MSMMHVKCFVSYRHAGAAHDSRIFAESQLYQQLLREAEGSQPLAVVADEAYACNEVCLTSVKKIQRDTITNASWLAKVKRFNATVRSFRVVSEHAIGVWKRRFPIMLYQLRARKLENVQNLIGEL